MTINLADHVMNLKGREYLPVAPRIVAFREACPGWSIMTEPLDIGQSLYCKAIILDDSERVIATAHKVVTSFAGGAFEKAETGAIGRALSLCGYGTLAAQDMDEGDDIADSPAPPRRNGATPPPPPPASKPAADPKFTERIAAATTSAQVDAILAEIAKVDQPQHRANAEKLAHARLVALALPVIGGANAAVLSKIEKRLGTLPGETPGLNEALDRIIARTSDLTVVAHAPAEAVA